MERINEQELYEGLLNEVKEGRVRMFRHPNYPDIVGFNYNEECQFNKSWNKYNKRARGLVFLEPNKYCSLARQLNNPFPKIFNFEETGITEEELLKNIKDGNVFNITQKHDGSLIIIFRHPYLNEMIIMTRGSFNSEQAQLATNLFNSSLISRFNEGSTELYELVGPSNKNVCRTCYVKDKLIPIGYGTKDCVTCNSDNNLWNLFDKFDLNKITSNNDPNYEGIVIEFLEEVKGHQFIKIKSDLYKKLHKVLTGEFTISRLIEIWVAAHEGSSLGLNGIPDEFFSEINQYLFKIDKAFIEFQYLSDKQIDKLMWKSKELTRKEIALSLPELIWAFSWFYSDNKDNLKELDKIVRKRFIKKILEGELCQNILEKSQP